jgi:hypothetical protein
VSVNVSWSKKLPEPVRLKSGRELRTLKDAGEMVLRLPEMIRHSPKWAYAAELLLQAARTGKKADIVDAWHQVCRAAKTDNYLAPET